MPEPLYLVPLTMETSSHQGPSVTLVKDAAKAGAAKPNISAANRPKVATLFLVFSNFIGTLLSITSSIANSPAFRNS